jgi:transcriptional regulator with XRE-family HTH domain
MTRKTNAVPLSSVLARIERTAPEAATDLDYSSTAAAFGEHIRRVRRTCGLTQKELARRAGMSPTELSDIERGRGKRGPSLETVNKLYSVLTPQSGLKDLQEALVARLPAHVEKPVFVQSVGPLFKKLDEVLAYPARLKVLDGCVTVVIMAARGKTTQHRLAKDETLQVDEGTHLTLESDTPSYVIYEQT